MDTAVKATQDAKAENDYLLYVIPCICLFLHMKKYKN